MSIDQALNRAHDRAQRAGDGARATVGKNAPASTIRLGKIVGINGANYTVEVQSSSGGVSATISGITAPGGPGLLIGEVVFLMWIGQRPVPYIQPAGGNVIAFTGNQALFHS